jgi:hypothetical protein
MAQAKQSHTQVAPDRAVENLLAEIASTAYLTEQRLRNTPGDIPELYEHEVELLRNTVARLGWMADLALKRLGSLNTMRDGDAAAWMLTPLAVELLSQEVQS